MLFCLFLIICGALSAYIFIEEESAPLLGLACWLVFISLAVILRFTNPSFFGVF